MPAGHSLLHRLEVPAFLVLVLLTQSEVWLGWSDGGGGVVPHGDRLARSALALVTVLPLLARQRWPLSALGVTCAGIAVQVALVTPYVSFLAALLPMAIGSFSVAVHARGWRWAGLVLTFGTLGVLAARIPEERQESEVLFGVLVLTSVWLAGDVVRSRLHRADLTEAEAAVALAGERSRIARELHDVIAHGVSVMGVQAGAARRLLDRGDDGAARQSLLAIEETARSSVGELQRLLAVLREADETGRDLEPQPGVERLPCLVEQVRAAGLPVELDAESLPTLSPGLDLVVYRVVQEALTNALKHSGAPTRVCVVTGPDDVRVEVTSGPAPGAPASRGAGHGLIGMRERVSLYGGSLTADPTPSGGFRVLAVLPG